MVSRTLGTRTAVLPIHRLRLDLKLVWSVEHEAVFSHFCSYMTFVALANGVKKVSLAARTRPWTIPSHLVSPPL